MSAAPAPAPASAPSVMRAVAWAGARAFLAAYAFSAILTAVDLASFPDASIPMMRLIASYLALVNGGTIGVSGQLLGESAGVSLGLIPLLGTGITAWVIFRESARLEPGAPASRRIVVGAAAGVVYAALCLVVMAPGAASWSLGSVDLRVDVPPALAGALLLGVTAGCAGALSAGKDVPIRFPRLGAAVAGAWQMALWGTVAAFLALMLLAAIAQRHSRAYLVGFRAARGDAGIAALAHNAALLPNEAVWTLAASMGSCIGVQGSIDVQALCWTRFPTGAADETIAPSVPAPETSRSIPLEFLVFVPVAPIAVAAGGRAAAATLAGRPGEAALRGAMAGVVFTPLLVVLAWLSSLRIATEGLERLSGSVIVGPNLPMVAAAALAWGIVGGTLSASAIAWRAGRRRAAVAEPDDRAPT